MCLRFQSQKTLWVTATEISLHRCATLTLRQHLSVNTQNETCKPEAGKEESEGRRERVHSAHNGVPIVVLKDSGGKK